MQKFRTKIRIFWQAGVSREQLVFVAWAIRKFLVFANAGDKISLEMGNSMDLSAFKIFSETGWSGYLDSDAVLRHLNENPAHRKNEFYSVLLTKDQLNFPLHGQWNYTFGSAYPGESAVVCVEDSSKITDYYVRRRVFETTVHEVGHIFGLVPDDRKESIIITLNYYKHCGNRCVMYPYIGVINDLNLEVAPFCPMCLWYLQDYFNGK